MTLNHDENPMHASHDAIGDPSLLADAIEALPEQETRRYAQVTDEEIEVTFKDQDSKPSAPLQHLSIVRDPDDPTHFDAIDKRLESDKEGKSSRKNAIIASGLTATAVIVALAGATYAVHKKKKK
jgi:hypothetical protein